MTRRTSSLLTSELRLQLCSARDLLAADHDEAVTLAEIARRSGLPLTKLIRRFATTFGETPHRYRTRLRLHRAIQLLEGDDESVTSICMKLGYASLGSFSWKFARAFGAAPDVYRRRFFPSAAFPRSPSWLYGDSCCALLIAGLNGSAQFSRSTATSIEQH